METAENIVSKLNEMLEADHFETEAFNSLIKALRELCNPTLKFLDFEYYNEKLLKTLKKEKIRLISIQDFEGAALIREKEKECQGYISIREEYRIERSDFYYDQVYLFYFYLGNSKNDKLVRDSIKYIV